MSPAPEVAHALLDMAWVYGGRRDVHIRSFLDLRSRSRQYSVTIGNVKIVTGVPTNENPTGWTVEIFQPPKKPIETLTLGEWLARRSTSASDEMPQEVT